MPAFSFQKSFVDPIKLGLKSPRAKGAKRQTIRTFRVNPPKVGQMIYLYYAMRTKLCQKLGQAPLKERLVVVIYETGIELYSEVDYLITDPEITHRRILSLWKEHKLDCIKTLYTSDLDKFARQDGFQNWVQMKRWWSLTHGPDCFPFCGHLYIW